MCGLAGVFNARKAAEIVYVMGHTLQHRAVEYAGIATSDGAHLYRHADTGIVQEVFPQQTLDRLHGRSAVLHLRYSTVADNPDRDNTQPIVLTIAGSEVAIAHNGNLTNVAALRAQLRDEHPSTVFKTSTDTEVLLHRIARATGTMVERIQQAVRGVQGTYALILLLPDKMIAVRDPSGNRPLVLGQRDGASYLASETSALLQVEVPYVREVLPGEILVIDKSGEQSHWITASEEQAPKAFDIFELLYYALPSSTMFGISVSQYRQLLGEMLERYHPVLGADIVVGVPDSALAIAEGFARSGRSGVLSRGLLRSHFVGRTFIQPNQALRDIHVKRKFFADPQAVGDKSIALIEDSVVRLTTLPPVIRLLRNAGAREIHVRVATPQVIAPCYYGIDTPTRQELGANRMTLEEMRVASDADSLAFLTVPQLRSTLKDPDKFCFACMTGDYPLHDPSAPVRSLPVR